MHDNKLWHICLYCKSYWISGHGVQQGFRQIQRVNDVREQIHDQQGHAKESATQNKTFSRLQL